MCCPSSFFLGFRGQEFIVPCMSLSESEGKTVVSRATGSTPSHHISGQDTAGEEKGARWKILSNKRWHTTTTITTTSTAFPFSLFASCVPNHILLYRNTCFCTLASAQSLWKHREVCDNCRNALSTVKITGGTIHTLNRTYKKCRGSSIMSSAY